MSRHVFAGGNAFMLRMLSRYRDALGVAARPVELEATATATLHQLAHDTATVAVDGIASTDRTLAFDVVVTNLTGHKLPTGYPSRRAWLHVVTRDEAGRVIFESGRVRETGAIEGNAADEDGTRFEPHHTEITRGDDVQIYESIMGTPSGRPTTGLLQATQYLKDNRLLPRGFDKRTAAREIGVFGGAGEDSDFAGGTDRVRYRIAIDGAKPASIEVELRYQPIAYRWAQNLTTYEAPEPKRFVGYFDAMAGESSAVLARVVRSLN
jgi:hypothetical protein